MTDHIYSRKEQIYDFYGNLGLCISGWAKVDGFLFRIFKSGSNLEAGVASLIYYRTNSLMDRANITNDIVRVLLNTLDVGQTPLSRKWDRIFKRIKSGIEFRNHIAHNPVYSSPEVDYEIYTEFTKDPSSPDSLVQKGDFKLAKEPYRYYKEMLFRKDVVVKSSDIVSISDMKRNVREVYALALELNLIEMDFDAYRSGNHNVEPEPDIIG